MLPLASLLLAATLTQTAPVALTNGLVLTKSATIAPREYALPSPEGLKPAITIRGNNITLDFNGATLRGTPATAEPDQRKGLAVLIEGNNVTVKNLHVHGYKVGLMAANCKGLRVLDSDFSYNWKARLASTLEKEDEKDWQSYHHNEHNEWLRYGAGIYLEGCIGFDVWNSKITGGQCGLMLVRSEGGHVWNNNFTFLSGVGLGLYRSSNNRVLFNKLDWCVRGFSYGVYNRGQDSAGILVFESSNANVFAYNSVTHGGDGFFLWAGQSTMDTGKGGCNKNILYANDFSHSPCNGIEATFSTNTFVNNKLVECWHGIWGGYSFNTTIAGNLFAHNGEAIAIEHGQNNSITYNLFFHENTAIDLWQTPISDPKWPYPKHHDTASRDYQIAGNVFDGSTGPAIALQNTTQVLIGGNLFQNCSATLKESGQNPGSRFDIAQTTPGTPPAPTISPNGQPMPGASDNVGEYFRRFDIPWAPFADIQQIKRSGHTPAYAEQRVVDAGFTLPTDKNHRDPFLPQGALRGQRYILIDQWGPYDFKRPILWPREALTPTRRRFEILGPKGHWRITATHGFANPSTQSGPVPGFLDIDLSKIQDGHAKIQLEYTGEATTDYRGIPTPAGTPVPFSYAR